jgi:predicted Zn-dependent protease with MMP-like domain
MDRQQIIMNFTIPPAAEDLEAIAKDTLGSLPEELARHCENLGLQIEDFPDEIIEAEMELNDPYELVALFRSGSQLSPGVKSKVANDDDILILYRRPLLDMWCDTGEDLNVLVRQVIIEELGQNFEFTEIEIDEMVGAAASAMR